MITDRNAVSTTWNPKGSFPVTLIRMDRSRGSTPWRVRYSWRGRFAMDGD